MNNKRSIIATKNLTKSFKNDKNVNLVLHNVNVDIYEKDFTVIMGSSGSGKSTLIYCLSGMDKATSGEVILDNHYQLHAMKENDLIKMRRKEVGFIFQQMHLVQNMTVIENIVVAGYLLKNQSSNAIHNHARNLLKKFGISELEKRYPTQISGGEQQRVAIARALINSPAIVFADEPTGALNSTSSNEVLDVLTKCSNDGQSIVMVTHDIKAAMRANRIIYLKDGSIISELELSTYDTESATANRENKIQKWLTELGW